MFISCLHAEMIYYIYSDERGIVTGMKRKRPSSNCFIKNTLKVGLYDNAIDSFCLVCAHHRVLWALPLIIATFVGGKRLITCPKLFQIRTEKGLWMPLFLVTLLHFLSWPTSASLYPSLPPFIQPWLPPR